MTRRSIAAMAALVAAVSCAPALAQSPCGDRVAIVRMLDEKYHERRIAVGVTAEKVLEVFVSPAGSWTIALSRPSGLTCLIAAGDGFLLTGTTPKKPTGQEL